MMLRDDFTLKTKHFKIDVKNPNFFQMLRDDFQVNINIFCHD